MQEEYIELVPEGLTKGVALQEAYFLMLREKNGKRYLPSLLDKDEYQQIFTAIHDKRYPYTHLMSRLSQRFNIQLESVHLFYPSHGNMSATMVFNNGTTKINMVCNIAEGITAAMENCCPILMAKPMFDEQIFRQKGEGQVSMPITAMNKALLQEALQAAVAEENFELASVIRDEIKQRESMERPNETEQW